MTPFKISITSHVIIILLTLVFSFFQGCVWSKPPSDVPMFELLSLDANDEIEESDVIEEIVVVEIPPPPLPPPLPEKLPEPPPIVIPEADAIIKDEVKETPPPPQPPKPEEPKKEEPKPEKKPIQVSNVRVTRDTQKKPVEKPVEKPAEKTPAKPAEKTKSFADTHTAVDSKSINVGTPTPGNPNLKATERDRINNAIREALIVEWKKESVSALEGSRPAVLELTLNAAGRVTEAKVTTSSGSKIFDDAAVRAARRTTIKEVTPAYLREAKNKVIVPFNF